MKIYYQSIARTLFLCVLNAVGIHAIDQYGEYEVTRENIRLRGVLDRSNPSAVVVFPEQLLASDDHTEKFPLLVLGGNFNTYIGHQALLNGLASFGFIVVAPRSCHRGCPGYGRWNTYPQEILNLVDYIDESPEDPIFQFVDRSAGYGILGHSTGGRATIEALTFADQHNIKAGISLHPAPSGSEGVSQAATISVPIAVFTGTSDGCCGEQSSRLVYDAIESAAGKAYANMVGALHTEPNLFSTRWTAYIAAWFKIYLNGDTELYYDQIFGNATDSLCGGEIAMNNDCETIP